MQVYCTILLTKQEKRCPGMLGNHLCPTWSSLDGHGTVLHGFWLMTDHYIYHCTHKQFYPIYMTLYVIHFLTIQVWISRQPFLSLTYLAMLFGPDLPYFVLKKESLQQKYFSRKTNWITYIDQLSHENKAWKWLMFSNITQYYSYCNERWSIYMYMHIRVLVRIFYRGGARQVGLDKVCSG